MAIQKHAPENCPAGDDVPKPLYAPKAEGVTFKGIYACPPAHEIYYLVEADDFNAIQACFAPGMAKSTLDIKPVVEAIP